MTPGAIQPSAAMMRLRELMDALPSEVVARSSAADLAMLARELAQQPQHVIEQQQPGIEQPQSPQRDTQHEQPQHEQPQHEQPQHEQPQHEQQESSAAAPVPIPYADELRELMQCLPSEAAVRRSAPDLVALARQLNIARLLRDVPGGRARPAVAERTAPVAAALRERERAAHAVEQPGEPQPGLLVIESHTLRLPKKQAHASATGPQPHAAAKGGA